MSVFEKMMQDFEKENAAELLENCMTFQPGKTRQIPLRYRLIAVGFLSKMSLEELNNTLKKEGCEQLYSRNSLEAGLIFAFLNHMSYKEWKRLQQKYSALMEDVGKNSPYFSGSTVTYGELEKYVKENSQERGDILHTRKVTGYLDKKLAETRGNEEKFRDFLIQNQDDFSRVREKTRYYFCKYLYYYIEQKIEDYLEACRSGFGVEQAASELFILKSASKLRQRKLSEEKIREILRSSSISFGNIYDAFNFYYFDYVSSDWMEVLLEYYGNPENIHPDARKELAKSLRNYEPKWQSKSDDEVIREKYRALEERERELDAVYSLEGSTRGYQKNRSGEKSVRNYVKGILDIDRTTLICYLLFFGSALTDREEHAITGKRLNEILLECGFACLREEDDFDYFVTEYLNAEDPVDYLMESVTQYALQEKNFFLYHMYRNSVNNDETIRKLMK